MFINNKEILSKASYDDFSNKTSFLNSRNVNFNNLINN